MACATPVQRGAAPLTQLRVGLGSASPTLRNPLPPILGGEGRVRGAARTPLTVSSTAGRPKAGGKLAMTPKFDLPNFSDQEIGGSIPYRFWMAFSAAALPVDLHIGEKRHKRMGTHRDD
jgi:hypothetical protein